VASALNGMAERLRGGANSMRDEAAKIGSQAAKLSNDALRRLSDEVEHRPLVTLAVAVGVGILVGLASHRRPHPPSPHPTRSPPPPPRPPPWGSPPPRRPPPPPALQFARNAPTAAFGRALEEQGLTRHRRDRRRLERLGD